MNIRPKGTIIPSFDRDIDLLRVTCIKKILLFDDDIDYSKFDFYPTTLTSLGIGFEGNRLGLGTDLFSNEQTLCEKYGVGSFFSLVQKHSTFYDNHILYGFE